MKSLGLDIYGFILLSWSASWISRFISPSFWEVYSQCSFKHFFSFILFLLFWDSYNVNIIFLVIMLQVPEALLIFSISFFLFLRFSPFYCSVFQFTDFPDPYILLLIPSTEFLTTVNVLSVLKFPFSFFFYILYLLGLSTSFLRLSIYFYLFKLICVTVFYHSCFKMFVR